MTAAKSAPTSPSSRNCNALQVAVTIFKRGEPQVTPEHFGQVIAVAHAHAPCNLVGGQIGLGQKTASELYASA
jgi:hypothetical protein